MKIIRFLFGYSRWRVTLAVLGSVVAGLGNVGLVALINFALGPHGYPLGLLAAAFVGLALLLTVGRAISSLILTGLTQNAVLDMRMQMSRKILTAPLRQLEELGAPRLMATLNGDISSIINGLLTFPNLCLQVTMLVGCLAYLIWLSWVLFLGVTAFLVVGVTSYMLGQRIARRYLSEAREQHDVLFKHFRAMTEGAKELKLHRRRRETFFDHALRPTAVTLRQLVVRSNLVFTAAGSWGQLLFYMLIGFVLLGVPAIRPVAPSVTVGYVFIILYISVILEVLLASVPALTTADVALRKVESLGLTLTAQGGDGSEARAGVERQHWESVELSQVQHTYFREREDSYFMLGPVDLTLRPGLLTFITGGNGSGKTTLAKLLTGLYMPQGGRILLDGEPVTEENVETYRQLFSCVFSDFYLFDSLLGLEGAGLDEKAGDYLRKLQLDHKVGVREGSLSTTDLSQGQRKRLALLTAYLEDRPIYLFDEWAADQDPLFKDFFYLQILPELRSRGKAVVVITHDDRYYHLADQLLKLDEGKLAVSADLGVGDLQATLLTS